MTIAPTKADMSLEGRNARGGGAEGNHKVRGIPSQSETANIRFTTSAETTAPVEIFRLVAVPSNHPDQSR